MSEMEILEPKKSKKPPPKVWSKVGMQAALLREVVHDGDLHGAARRAGLSPTQLSRVKRDEAFMGKIEKQVNKYLEATGGAEAAISKFMRTQEILAQALQAGDMGVAGSLMKSHDVELRMHGLFEKDNNQKRNPVMINIDLSGGVDV